MGRRRCLPDVFAVPDSFCAQPIFTSFELALFFLRGRPLLDSIFSLDACSFLCSTGFLLDGHLVLDALCCRCVFLPLQETVGPNARSLGSSPTKYNIAIAALFTNKLGGLLVNDKPPLATSYVPPNARVAYPGRDSTEECSSRPWVTSMMRIRPTPVNYQELGDKNN